MRDYIKRVIIALIMALCVSLLFLGGRHSEASMKVENEVKDGWIWPADGIISDTYGTRMGKHKGIDIAGKLNTPVLAVADGQVVKSYYSNTYGNVVFIKHPSHFVTVYAHLNKRNVFEGQKVKQGTEIGKMGKTGQATGTHLHFETHQEEWRYDKKFALDPEKILGRADTGETVRGGIAASYDDVLEASSHIKIQNEDKLKPYIVKQGDTLYSISMKRNISVKRIKELNHLSSDLIKPKQILNVN
ncbi:peptidoglycan DD-metalloendopeptidase family protein [Bacillus sp. sid0103]|uniref:peptidoglycan DD-metalloendopeptidase family protein n=1 Tax=Bacillus sp. sid0103 TaxID=2856337 RepID=UPI001C44F399|nr:peptidoglycan DD-metalloendopeptidase family protein [Bacillus sp. sid0103]MBV7507175.1 peptidoglycan DD-metalloendopeptidase family protein [Bacillus sp. sid0103]